MCKYGLSKMYFVYASSLYFLLSTLKYSIVVILADTQRGSWKEYNVLEMVQFETCSTLSFLYFLDSKYCHDSGWKAMRKDSFLVQNLHKSLFYALVKMCKYGLSVLYCSMLICFTLFFAVFSGQLNDAFYVYFMQRYKCANIKI